MSIKSTLLGTTETTVIQAGSSTTAVLSIVFCNTDSVTRSITVHACPSGVTAGIANVIISALPIAAGDSYIWTASEKFILDPSDSISGFVDAVAGNGYGVVATPCYMVI